MFLNAAYSITESTALYQNTASFFVVCLFENWVELMLESYQRLAVINTEPDLLASDPTSLVQQHRTVSTGCCGVYILRLRRFIYLFNSDPLSPLLECIRRICCV